MGDRFLLKIPGGGGGRPGGAEGPGGCLRRIGEFLGGGGGKYFFSGPKCPPRIGGVLQYKLVYCGVSLSPKFRSQQGTALQMGGVLRYKLEMYCQYLSDKLYGLGVPE